MNTALITCAHKLQEQNENLPVRTDVNIVTSSNLKHLIIRHMYSPMWVRLMDFCCTSHSVFKL